MTGFLHCIAFFGNIPIPDHYRITLQWGLNSNGNSFLIVFAGVSVLKYVDGHRKLKDTRSKVEVGKVEGKVSVTRLFNVLSWLRNLTGNDCRVNNVTGHNTWAPSKLSRSQYLLVWSERPSASFQMLHEVYYFLIGYRKVRPSDSIGWVLAFADFRAAVPEI